MTFSFLNTEVSKSREGADLPMEGTEKTILAARAVPPPAAASMSSRGMRRLRHLKADKEDPKRRVLGAAGFRDLERGTEAAEGVKEAADISEEKCVGRDEDSTR